MTRKNNMGYFYAENDKFVLTLQYYFFKSFL